MDSAAGLGGKIQLPYFPILEGRYKLTRVIDSYRKLSSPSGLDLRKYDGVAPVTKFA